MGITAVLAGVIGIFLPETVGLGLPETMDQAINLHQRCHRGIFTCVFPKTCQELWCGGFTDGKEAKSDNTLTQNK